jgi:hypothetical protein
MKRYLSENSLTVFFLVLFLATLLGQAFAGHADFNNQLLADGLQPISLGSYVTSSQYAVDVVENWQSEYLQFLVFTMATVWLIQKGSPESSEPDETGHESDQEQLVGQYAKGDSPAWAKVRGLRLFLFSWSFSIVMGCIFILCWFAQSVTGQSAYNTERLAQLQSPLSWEGYVRSADFWNRSLQNWQSEFLAVASMVAFSIYLRHRGSSQSKPVGAPHAATGVEG